MNLAVFARSSLLGALFLGTAAGLNALDFFDGAKKSVLLVNDDSLPPGTTRHGYTWYHYADASKAPKSVPAQNGWYRPAGQGSTTYWDDKNGNGQKDEGELRPTPYWLFFVTNVGNVRAGWSGETSNPESRLAGETAGQPAARRVSSLLGDSPMVSFGRRCFAVGQSLEIWVDTDVWLVLDPGTGSHCEFLGTNWLLSNRKDYRYLSARFPNAAEIDQAIRTLLGAPCAKASSDAALAMVKAWNQQVGARIGPGPDFKGLYPKELKAFLPTREEVAGDFVWTTNESSSLTNLELRHPENGLAASVGLRAETFLSEKADDPITRAQKKFADESKGKGVPPRGLPSVDEALELVDRSTCTIWFRRANVIGYIKANNGREGRTAAKSVALAHRLAEVMLTKLAGGTVTPPTPPPPRKIAVTASAIESSRDWMGEGYVGWIDLLVTDQDNDPVPCEPVQVAVADPKLGTCNLAQVFSDDYGKARVSYTTLQPGANTLVFTHASGKTELKVLHGGLVLEVDPQGQDGTVEMRARVLDPKTLRPMGGAPIRLNVYAPDLPGRGTLQPEEALSLADDSVHFVYTPPHQRTGPASLEVDIWANIDSVGYPLRLSTKTKATLRLLPPEKQP